MERFILLVTVHTMCPEPDGVSPYVERRAVKFGTYHQLSAYIDQNTHLYNSPDVMVEIVPVVTED